MKRSLARPDTVPPKQRLGLASLVLACLVAGSAHPELSAATRTWSGAGTNNLWSNASNWVEQVSPVAGYDVLFPAQANRKQMQNDLPDLHLNGVTVSGIGYRLTGNSLLLDNGIEVNHGSPVAGSFTFDADLQLNADQTFATTADSATLSLRNVALHGHRLACNTTLQQGYHTIYVWGDISGSGELTKTGPGSMIVNTPLTYSGIATIEEGSVTVRAAFGGAILNSPVRVQTNGILRGNGLVHSIECRGGAVRPSMVHQFEAGPLTVAHSASFDRQSKFVVEASGTIAGAQYNQLRASNTVDLGSCELEFSVSFSPEVGQAFVIIDNLGSSPVTGTFADLPEGGTFSLATDPRVFHVSYRGGDGNDVVVVRGFPPATALALTPFGDGLMRLQATGSAGASYRIEASADLKSWNDIGAAVADGTGEMQFIDTEASRFTERFYRIRSP